MSREYEGTSPSSAVIARLDRAIQYAEASRFKHWRLRIARSSRAMTPNKLFDVFESRAIHRRRPGFRQDDAGVCGGVSSQTQFPQIIFVGLSAAVFADRPSHKPGDCK